MKRVLVLYYSQSGQLKEILENLTASWEEEVSLHWHRIETEPAFDFPWKEDEFYDVFPETFLGETCELRQDGADVIAQDYDLIILGYTVWFLSPSMPIHSFLKSPEAETLFKDTPVLTLLACRNMWVMAQEKVKASLAALGANHVGHIALVDRHINHVSVLTIAHWMFTGKKTRYLGIFPKPGVSAEDIRSADQFAPPVLHGLQHSDFQHLQSELIALNAVRIHPLLVKMDSRANFLFSKWARFIKKKGNRGDSKRYGRVRLFNLYLHAAIWILAPIIMLIFAVTLPLRASRIAKDKDYYSNTGFDPNYG